MKICKVILATILAIASWPVLAQNYGHLDIQDSWIQAPLPGMKMTGGYVQITNHSSKDEHLLAAYSDIAASVELHTMEMIDGLMIMRKKEGHWTIAPGATLSLERGGKHIMFIDLQKPIRSGDMLPLVLEFNNAGKIKHVFMVNTLETMIEIPNHGDRDHDH